MREVILSRRASQKLEELFKYLESEWSLTVRDNFVDKLDQILIHLKIFPEIGQQSDLVKGLRRIVITKQTTIYYRFDLTTSK
jgi:plasmid stabilization system protein ParE